eukprot:sb/3466519/
MNSILQRLRLSRLCQNCVCKSQLSKRTIVDVPDQKVVRVGIFGSPNSGKSTLLNSLMQQYISPISQYRQTTVENVRGVITEDNIQMILIDTPGIMPAQFQHKTNSTREEREMYLGILENLSSTSLEIDCAVFMFDLSLAADRLYITRDTEALIEGMSDIPKYLVLNKIDKQKSRGSAKLEFVLDQLTGKRPDLGVPSMPCRTDIPPPHIPPVLYSDDTCDGAVFDDVFKISAIQGLNINLVWAAVRQCAVTRPWTYPPDTVSPDDVESVITALVRAEVMTKQGHMVNTLKQGFFGAVMEEGVLVIDHILYQDRNVFTSVADRQDSIKRMEMVLSSR